MKSIFLIFFLFAPFSLYAADKMDDADVDNGWVTIPAGAKPAYMGIHGGTMPVSLLVGSDGATLLSFVGKTGNDFLEALRQGKFLMPTLGNSTSSGKINGSTALFAGNSTSSLPVYSAGISGNDDFLKKFAPFGFSANPLVIEGFPSMPQSVSAIKKYREFYLPGSLQLQRRQ